MTNRLRVAGTALGALILPACSGFPISEPHETPRMAPAPIAAYRPMPGVIGSAAKGPREQFAAGRNDTVTRTIPTAEPTVATKPIERVEHKEIEVAPPPRPVEHPRPAIPLTPTSPNDTKLVPGPTPDSEGVIRPPKPVIPGAPPFMADPPKLDMPGPMPEAKLPVLESVPSTKTGEQPASIVAPSSVIGSTSHQTHASPDTLIPVAYGATVEETPAPFVNQDSALIQAIRAFEKKKGDEANSHLASIEPATRAIIMALLPTVVRLSECSIRDLKPDDADLILANLAKVTPALRSSASLQVNNVRLCREVHKFGYIDTFSEQHLFRPGEVVHVYWELANFSVQATKNGFTMSLGSSLELRDGSGHVAWRADPKEIPDLVLSPLQDYYRAFRLCIPAVPVGTYTLSIKTIDRPTGREANKTVELRIGVK